MKTKLKFQFTQILSSKVLIFQNVAAISPGIFCYLMGQIDAFSSNELISNLNSRQTLAKIIDQII